jgi:hypothetical protein
LDDSEYQVREIIILKYRGDFIEKGTFEPRIKGSEEQDREGTSNGRVRPWFNPQYQKKSNK